MTEKRFTLVDIGFVYDNDTLIGMKKIVELLNMLYEEKEDWKANCLSTVNENSILWNEIAIMREQGAKPSNAFEEYCKKFKGDGV